MKVLVTGGAGFIGSHTSERLLRDGHRVAIVDDFNDYYNPAIKRANLRAILPNIQLFEEDIRDPKAVRHVIAEAKPDTVVHLAARAGVRPSIEAPELYIDTNIKGTSYLLEECRRQGVSRFISASSSSVYGVNEKIPFSEEDSILQTISPYAMTKMATEQICSNYAQLYKIRTVSLRFFTVYGPRQRPDLAISKFTRAIEDGKPIDKYGAGHTKRDYTFVSDIVDGIVGAMKFEGTPLASIYNLGGSQTVSLNDLISTIEHALGKTAIIHQMPEQPGDVPLTSADVSKAVRDLGFRATTPIDQGIPKFVEWFRQMRAEGNIV